MSSSAPTPSGMYQDQEDAIRILEDKTEEIEPTEQVCTICTSNMHSIICIASCASLYNHRASTLFVPKTYSVAAATTAILPLPEK